MMDTPPELGFSIAEVAKAILIGIGSVTLWLLKKLGDKHISSLDDVVTKQNLILERISASDVRLAVLETKVNEHLHHRLEER